ncbi:MAG TPA: PQQ-dependent sugar dehydrogenase, partial [Kofleriaceae bacterium]|nr:PQQ-dependent sugar dehydrogenase [Kofleriaceae bacterium]
LGDGGAIYLVESGYSYGEVFTRPRLVEIARDGRGVIREIASGRHAPWNGVAFAGGALYVAQGGQLEGGRVVRFDLDGGARVLVDDLPSTGDHHTSGPVIGRDGWIYFGQGTATNAGVVGTDNHDYGWLARRPRFHDVPCRDVTLRGANFETGDPLTPEPGDRAVTGAYVPFGTATRRGQVIPGRVPCSGAILRVHPEGSAVELVAWGFRNPFGLAVAPDGRLYATENGFDVRGSRPVFGAADPLWRVEPGRWYGWPDFAEGRPLTIDFYAEGGGAPRGFLLAEHPGRPPEPVAYLAVHSSAGGLDFSRDAAFGRTGDAFVALFGDMAPETGKVMSPVGFKVVRVNPETGVIEDFARNGGDKNGPASLVGGGGLERPIAARFDRSGRELYVVDFGVLRMTDAGPVPQPETGVLWRITREAAR